MILKTDLSNITIITAANDDSVLAANLASSPLIAEGKVELHVERGHPSISLAYNSALKHFKKDIVVFAHQDVYLPRGWEIR